MSRNSRRLVILLLLWVLPLALAAGAAFWVSHAGKIEVSVVGHEPGGQRVHVVVPAAAVNLALLFIPERIFVDAADDVDQWGPVVGALGRELSRCPDGVLVDVRSPRETTLIEKRGRSLVINVNSDLETVHVTMPLGTLNAVMAKLGRIRSCRPMPGAIGGAVVRGLGVDV